jgi:DNA-directed RNA polymerase specialized sigma54-like protein
MMTERLSEQQKRFVRRAAKVRKRLTNKALAARCNVSQATISRCIGGRKR